MPTKSRPQPNDQRTATNPFADGQQPYREHGEWPVLVLPPGQKGPPPSGTTGAQGRDLTPTECVDHAQRHPDGNIALRLPAGVIGIDVDHYGNKRGGDTLDEAERQWGALPPTYRTSRIDGVAGTRLFRVPKGLRLQGRIAFAALGLGDIDIIQHHHRYTLVYPSIHPSGQQYQWYRGAKRTAFGSGSIFPYVSELPDLPEAWVRALRVDSADPAKPATTDEVAEFINEVHGGEPCTLVRKKLDKLCAELLGTGAARHDTMLSGSMALWRLGEAGHHGAPEAQGLLTEAFCDAVTADGTRTLSDALCEADRAVNGADGIGQILASRTPSSARVCHCPERPDASTDDTGDERHQKDLAREVRRERVRTEAIDIVRHEQAARRVQQAGEPRPGTTWAVPCDIAALLAGEIETPTPDVLVRTDGHGLLYRGEINGVFGEPECGKTWLVLAACAEQLLAGAQVFYLDYENGEEQLVRKLQQLQVPDEVLVSGLTLWVPENSLDEDGSRAYRAALADKQPTVVALDSVSGPLGVEGFGINSADDFERFGQLYLRPAAEAGAAVLTIDHVVKDSEKRGSWEIGTQRKKGIATGAKYEVRTGEPFKPGAVNKADLWVSKDRYGAVREHSPDGQAGVFVLDSTDPDAMSWKVTSGSPQPEQLTEDVSVAGIIQRLNAMQADPGVGRPKARALLQEHHPGYRVGDKQLGEAIRLRKAAAEGAA